MTVLRSLPLNVRTLFLYAQDTHGMGHVTRTLTIARHVLARYPNAVAYVATASPVAGQLALPPRCDYIKLPTLLTPDGVRLAPPQEEEVKRHFRRLRGAILRDAVLGLEPDVVLVDHEPLGAKGEFADGLAALKAQRPETRFVFGLRDIMDDTVRIRAQWRELGVYEALEHLYDGIAVYGSPALYDVAEAYGIPPCVRPKLHYCGYVVRDLPQGTPEGIRRQHGLPANGRLVLASVGSGRDGCAVLQHAGAAIARLQARDPDLSAIVVTGPFMPEEDAAILHSLATPRCRVVTQADNLQLFAAADAVVSMGGYNSVCEVLAAGRPLVVVPRATDKVEQEIRARLLAQHGLARCVHPRELNAGRLADALEWALSCDRAAHARRVREVIPSFDGAARLTAYLTRWLGGD